MQIRLQAPNEVAASEAWEADVLGSSLGYPTSSLLSSPGYVYAIIKSLHIFVHFFLVYILQLMSLRDRNNFCNT